MQISVKAWTDNTLRDVHNSPNDMKAEFNNCVITSFNKSYFENKLKHAYLERYGKVPSSIVSSSSENLGYCVFTINQ